MNAAKTLIGADSWTSNYMSGRIAGVYAVDAFLTQPEIQAVVSRINAGEDTLLTCSECTSGTYFWNGVCNACMVYQISLQNATSINDCLCIAGFTSAIGNTCSPCAAGKFKDAIGSQECSFCPDNSNSKIHSTMNTDCECKPGYTGINGGECTQCDVSKFKSANGPAECTDCPANSETQPPGVVRDHCLCYAGFSGPGTSTCAPCPAGQYKEFKGSAHCSVCPMGSGSLEVGANNRDVCLCPAGFTDNGSGMCAQCLPGKYKQASMSCIASTLRMPSCMPLLVKTLLARLLPRMPPSSLYRLPV